MVTARQQRLLLLDAISADANHPRRVRLCDTVVFEVDHRADRLEHVVVVRDSEGRLAVALNELITPGGRVVVMQRPGEASAAVRAVREAGRPRRWKVTLGAGTTITVGGDLTQRPVRFVSGAQVVAETSVEEARRQYRVVVRRPQDTLLVLGTVLAIEHLARYA
jgi:uncharacterized protein YxjI